MRLIWRVYEAVHYLRIVDYQLFVWHFVYVTIFVISTVNIDAGRYNSYIIVDNRRITSGALNSENVSITHCVFEVLRRTLHKPESTGYSACPSPRRLMRRACSRGSLDSDARAVVAEQTDTRTHRHRHRAPQYLLRSLSDVAMVMSVNVCVILC